MRNMSVCLSSEEREEVLECYGEHENVDFDRSVTFSYYSFVLQIGQFKSQCHEIIFLKFSPVLLIN